MAALTKTKDAGKFGVGYFQPDNCDHDTIACEFNGYPEYENLKKAYTTTKDSTVTFDDYTPTRDEILTCPSKISSSLPATPDGTNSFLLSPLSVVAHASFACSSPCSRVHNCPAGLQWQEGERVRSYVDRH